MIGRLHKISYTLRIWDEQKIFERYNEIANDATVIWHL